MDVTPLVKGVCLQIIDAALDDVQVSFTGEQPRVPLLVADAAVAFIVRLDFGQLDLVDESAAMAVSTVCLESIFGHGVSRCLRIVGRMDGTG